MRPFTLILRLAGILIAVTVVPVFAPIQGLKQLNECFVDNFNKSGGKGTNGAPADIAAGGFSTGMIPERDGQRTVN